MIIIAEDNIQASYSTCLICFTWASLYDISGKKKKKISAQTVGIKHEIKSLNNSVKREGITIFLFFGGEGWRTSILFHS